MRLLNSSGTWNIGHTAIATWDSHRGPPLLAGHISRQTVGDRVVRPGCRNVGIITLKTMRFIVTHDYNDHQKHIVPSSLAKLHFSPHLKECHAIVLYYSYLISPAFISHVLTLGPWIPS